MEFRDWLSSEMEARDVSRRELARRLATKHPKGVTPGTVETYRSAIKRYLAGTQVPIDSTRGAIADALGVDRSQLPEDEEEEVDLERMVALLEELAHNQAELSKQLSAAIASGTLKEVA